ncbi:anthranilate phosphoribosyltransferase [Paenibacillus antri]|uniref:Anthranilate phosphoribosyltransferase n=1 Tax=Paenibacillus antri TaxID=2582848 RepID=A0A5R9GDC1_9BACL|nr:anthranilate phosphoribosyltransferase [Paenibacillus antri]TLS51184.1 anthranilate phosphoribosyltransferase [Paenibacillus antri]
MIEYLKEVGRGKRGARDLTFEEAAGAAKLILEGGATDAQIGAFLVAERIKMESTDEIAAFAEALRRGSLKHPMDGAIDCAGPYDGRTKSFYATLPTSFVLAACGVPSTLHGSRSLPPKWGVTLPDVVAEWGVDVETPEGLDRLLRAADASGFLFVPAELGCPKLARVRDIRTQLGLRTVFNSAEKLVRYSDAPYLVFGVFHGTVFDKMAQLVSSLGYRRAIIVQGIEGSEDLPVHKRSRLFLVKDGVSELMIVDPEVYQLQGEADDDTEWTAERQAATCLAVLQGAAALPHTDMTILNAGVRLWLTGAAGTIEEGLDLARVTLSSGQAYKKFLQWKEIVLP